MAFNASDYVQQWDGYGESHDLKNDSATITYKVPWSVRTVAKTDLLNRIHSDYAYLTCSSIKIEKFGDPDTTNKGPLSAKVMASFTPIDSGSGNTQNNWADWTEHWTIGGQAITLKKGFKWSSDDAPMSLDRGKVVKMFPMATITITGTTDQLDALAKAALLECVGTINDAEVTIKGYAFLEKQVLFLGLDLQEQLQGGASVYQLTYKFLIKESTHNWDDFWREDTNPPKWDVLVDSAGFHPYDTSLFTNLNPANW